MVSICAWTLSMPRAPSSIALRPSSAVPLALCAASDTLRAFWLASNAVCLTSSTVAVVSLTAARSEEHTSELQSLMRISYAVFCLKKKIQHQTDTKIEKMTHINRNICIAGYIKD